MKIKYLAVLLVSIAALGGSASAQAPNNARMLSTPNAQTGTTYTFVAADTTRVTTFSNAGAVAVSLPNGATFGFGAGTMLSVVNLGAGTVTITCSSCTITAAGVTAATLGLSQGQGADIYGGIGSPAVNYVALPSPSGANIALQNSSVSFSAVDGIRFVDGATFATPQAAIANCPATDCWVMVTPGTQPMPTNFRSHLHLSCYVPGVPAATITAATNLVWGTPPADNKCIFTSATGTTLSGIWDFTIEGITLDCLGNNVNCLVLQNGVFESRFGTPSAKLVIQNTGTGAALTLNGGSVAGQSVVGNEFDVSIFNAGKGVVLTATAPGVSANNLFHFVHTQNTSIRAWEFVQNADSNRIEWAFISGLGNAAQGIAFNTGTPGTDVDADGNVFTHCLCADVQNPGSYTSTLVTVNKSVGNAILDWEIGPGITSGGGSELSNPNRYPFNYQITTDFNTTVNDGAISAAGNIAGRRYGTTGTPLVSGNFANNASNWGVGGPIFSTIRGTDSAFTVTATTGTGSPQANPSFVVTFADGSWGTVPICSATTMAAAVNFGISGVSSATQLTVVLIGTPAASTGFQVAVSCSQSPN